GHQHWAGTLLPPLPPQASTRTAPRVSRKHTRLEVRKGGREGAKPRPCGLGNSSRDLLRGAAPAGPRSVGGSATEDERTCGPVSGVPNFGSSPPG
ncbi:hypothetical protein CSHISOI_00633, partial [Colletotrichum shisoi]